MLSSKLTYLLQIVFGVCILYFLGCSFYLGYITANLIKEGLTISSEVLCDANSLPKSIIIDCDDYHNF